MILKWLGVAIELYSLFVFINTALLAPFAWNLERVLFVVGSGILAGACAYYSGLGFTPLVGDKGSIKWTLLTVPCVLWWGTVVPTLALLALSRASGLRS